MDNKVFRIILTIAELLLLIVGSSFIIETFLEFSYEYLIYSIVSVILFVFVLFYIDKKNKNQSVKHSLQFIKFRKEYKKVISKFDNPCKSLKTFIRKISWNQFKESGVLYPKIDDEERIQQLSQYNSYETLNSLMKILKECIDDNTLFVGFIKKAYQLNNETYYLTRALYFAPMPVEFIMLMLALYDKTFFNLEDLHYSEKYTKYVEETIEYIKKEFDPQLLVFKTDIEEFLNNNIK